MMLESEANVAETARKALEILRESGWCKGYLINEFVFTGFPADTAYKTGSHCLGGAWNMASYGDHHWEIGTQRYEKLAAVIDSQYPDFDHSAHTPQEFIAYWNNAPDRTQEDVERILEKLATAVGHIHHPTVALTARGRSKP